MVRQYSAKNRKLVKYAQILYIICIVTSYNNVRHKLVAHNDKKFDEILLLMYIASNETLLLIRFKLFSLLIVFLLKGLCIFVIIMINCISFNLIEIFFSTNYYYYF